jgi:hypothetical protein
MWYDVGQHQQRSMGRESPEMLHPWQKCAGQVNVSSLAPAASKLPLRAMRHG